MKIGKIPKDWEVVKLKNIIKELIMGQAPPSASYNKKGIGMPFVKATEFSEVYPRIEVWTTNPIKEVDENFLLISIAGTIGLVNKGIRCAIGRSVAGIKPDLTKIDFDYLYYFLKLNSKKLIGRGSSQKIIIARDLEEIKVIKPKSLQEQKAIANILSTVDKAIQKVDEIIAKTERLKRGLMQKLLTKGIGHKEFKDTEIGRIPKEWEVVRVGEIMGFVKGKKPEEVTDEYKENYLPYLSTEYLRENKATKFVKNPNDVVLADDGDLILLWDGSNAGEFFLGRRGVLSSTMVKIKLREKNYDQKFLFYLLKTKENYLKEQTRGTGIPHVDGSVLSSLKIPIPPLAEQQKIAEILSTIDKKLELEKKRKEKLERIKEGLMDLLLTGKLRVKV